MFHFQHEADTANAYRRRPWSIRGGHLALKQWNPSLTRQEVPFTTLAFWVQVHGLPELWISPNNLHLISGKAGNVVEVDLARDGGGTWKRFICIQIEVMLNRPHIPRIFFPRNDLPHLWISLRYENWRMCAIDVGLLGTKLMQAKEKHFLSWIRLATSSSPQGHGWKQTIAPRQQSYSMILAVSLNLWHSPWTAQTKQNLKQNF